jgi:Uma2 family endonuclease
MADEGWEDRVTTEPSPAPDYWRPPFENAEQALKYAIHHMNGERTEIVEGVIQGGNDRVAPTWDHEKVSHLLRRQVAARVDELGCIIGSGDLDLPGTSNWFIPDLAVVPLDLADGGDALTPDRTLLVVEVTSESNGDTDRVVKRRRYGQYQAPLYLLVDRQERSWTLFAEPGELGYTRADGPRPFGEPITLPEPFSLRLETDGF